MSFARITFVLLCWSVQLLSAKAAFTSLQIFGDGVCTTTNSPGGAEFHGNRFSNGRVWVEVLAQRQGLTYQSNRNWSFFGHDSPNLLQSITNYTAPADVATMLCVVWSNDADFVNFTSQFDAVNAQLALWTNAMNQSLSNHFTAIQNLYNKGVRTLVMPNVVDLMKVPFYSQLPSPEKSFIRQRIADYNSAFVVRLNQARAAFPNLVIHAPDIHGLLDDIVARAVDYGVTNALYLGQSIDALSDSNLADKSLNGPGRNYIFWEYLDPTAKVHEILGDTVQHMISPPRIGQIVNTGPSNELLMVNVPIGLAGVVEGSTNFSSWSSVAGFTGTANSQTVAVPATNPALWFHRLRFPFAWTWP